MHGTEEPRGSDGRPAVAHLRDAIDRWDACRDMAKEDADFDPIRDERAFVDLIGR